MNDLTDIPEELYKDEVVCFIADRYRTTPRQILRRFLVQEGVPSGFADATTSFRLEENEMEILRDLIHHGYPQKNTDYKKKRFL